MRCSVKRIKFEHAFGPEHSGAAGLLFARQVYGPSPVVCVRMGSLHGSEEHGLEENAGLQLA